MIGGDIEVALVGMGGYGIVYLRNLLREQKGLRLIATADTDPSRCELLDEVQKRKIPIYPTLEALLAETKPDLVVLSTPLQLHAEQVITCVEQGCHVLCEKPVASDPNQVQRMIAARDRAKKLVAIGYQWSFSEAIQNVKRDIISGKFGKAKKLRTSVLWPRGEQYFKRNDWAGKIRDPHGRLVLDSPVNNGCAHFLHNMFFVLGREMHESDTPASVTAELYRAHKIENYDTAVIRCTTTSGAEMIFIASHATQLLQEPLLKYEFELATIRYGGEVGTQITADLLDGSKIEYGQPLESTSDAKLRDVCDAIRDHRPVACGLEAAASQNTCMFAAQESMPEITDFPKAMVVTEGEYGHRITYVKNLETVLNACYESFALPTELRLDWAKPGRLITII